MLKKILVGVVICLAVIVAAFIWYFNNQSIKVTVIKEAYNLLTSEENKKDLEIKIMVNQKDTYISNIDKITSCYLHDYQDNEIYQLDLKEINLVSQVSISKENYYIYNFIFRFKASIASDIIINQAYLVLNYNNSKSLDIMIGSVSVYYKHSNGEELTLSCMKAVTRKIDNILTIEGIIFRLNSKKNVKVTKIECLDCNIVMQKGISCDYEKTNTSEDLDLLFNENYNYLNTTSQLINDEFNGREELVIRIGYLNHYEISSFPIRIYYLVDGAESSIDIDTFTFFVNNDRKVKISELTIYEFEYN